IETSIGYCFRDKSLLIEALCHASSRRWQGMSYDRLEFLGDSALDVLIANYYMAKYPASGSSALHMLRQATVNN
ncbi:ribonuclease III domain-containing protein, partial [Dissophora ornata]